MTEGTTEPKADAQTQPETVSKADYDKAVERAQRFEVQLTDVEKRFEPFKDENITRIQADREAYTKLLKDRSEDKDGKALDMPWLAEPASLQVSSHGIVLKLSVGLDEQLPFHS